MNIRARRAFVQGELDAVNYGSLTGVVTDDEWERRVVLLLLWRRYGTTLVRPT